jgi:hypothetical protein
VTLVTVAEDETLSASYGTVDLTGDEDGL